MAALNFPNNPSDGDRYEGENGTTYIWNGTYNYWKVVGESGASKVSIGDEPPIALPGQLWWDSSVGEMFVYYQDLDSAQWVPANSVTTTGVQTGISGEFIDITAESINDQSVGLNHIHNGDFRVAQRSPGVGATTTGYYSADRWETILQDTAPTNISVDRTDLPTERGFGSSIRLGVVTGQTNTTASQCAIKQTLEAQDVAQFLYGTINSKLVTVSFWIQSNLSGDVTVELTSQDGTYSCSQVVTIDSDDANSQIWSYKTATFPINLNGTRVTNQLPTSNGLSLAIWFGAGSAITTSSNAVNLNWTNSNNGGATRVSNNNIQISETDGAFVRITGVKLELGDKASPFGYSSYAQELERCLRYFQKGSTKTVASLSSGSFSESVQLGTMRSTPTVSYTALSGTVDSISDTNEKRFVVNYSASTANAYAVDWSADSDF